MSSEQRNTWKLCPNHSCCNKCNACIESWKKKSNKHSYNAQALKFVVMSLMNDNSEIHRLDITTNYLPEINISDLRSSPKASKCGICEEYYTYGGLHNHIAFSCGHLVCLTCYNNQIFRQNKKCPYCRSDIDKAVKLWL